MQRGPCGGGARPSEKPPKDGVGPRGKPECYYTSRVLNSTFRYVKFVKKLRALEEEQKKGAENKLKELHDQQTSDFFIRCDRRSLINNVSRRVDLCMASYEADLNDKRKRLKELYSSEEEQNIRKFVEQAQAGIEAVWQDKKDRLAYLMDKRNKEHADKYKSTPLSKCVDVIPCLYKLRAKEAQEIQLYQMREKQAKRMADMEFDKLWHAVAMKEADALKARMEVDAIEQKRKDLNCKIYTDIQLEEKRQQREREIQMMKEEAKWLKDIWNNDIRKEQEDQRQRAEKRKETAQQMQTMMQEQKQNEAKLKEENKIIQDTWDSLANQGLVDEFAAVKLARKKEKETNECNKMLIEQKKEIATMDTVDDHLFDDEARARQLMVDEKRCEYAAWAQKTNREVRQAMIDQIKDKQNAQNVLKAKMAEQDEYHKQLACQLGQLTDYKKLTDIEKRKNDQRNLVQQIEYNQLLKERAKQEELDQIKKAKLATQEYEDEMKKMLSRPFFSDQVHPFYSRMSKGVTMKEKCPCSKQDYCK